MDQGLSSVSGRSYGKEMLKHLNIHRVKNSLTLFYKLKPFGNHKYTMVNIVANMSMSKKAKRTWRKKHLNGWTLFHMRILESKRTHLLDACAKLARRQTYRLLLSRGQHGVFSIFMLPTNRRLCLPADQSRK